MELKCPLPNTSCWSEAGASLANVFCYEMGLSEQPGTLNIGILDPDKPNNFGGFAIQEHSGVMTIPLTTLDSLDLPNCHFIKVDVEGMELNVLKGAVNTINRCKPILYVENDRVNKSEPLARFIDSLGYAMYFHSVPLYNPANFLGNQTNVFGNIASKNLLCLPPGARVTVKLPRIVL